MLALSNALSDNSPLVLVGRTTRGEPGTAFVFLVFGDDASAVFVNLIGF